MRDWDWLKRAETLRREGVPYAIVTVIDNKGSTPREVGAKMIVTGETFFGTIGGGQLEDLVIKDARKNLLETVAGSHKYPLCFRTGQCCGGAVETFVELVGVGPELFLFGAGHVGQALCRVMVGTPFRVRLIDPRHEWIQHPALPPEVARYEARWQDFVAEATWDRHRTHVAVMTHEHQMDLDIIADVIERPAKFIGLIGSQTKWQRFQQRLANLGLNSDAIARVHCPIGIDIGGKAPQEVALSVAAQLVRLHYQDHIEGHAASD